MLGGQKFVLKLDPMLQPWVVMQLLAIRKLQVYGELDSTDVGHVWLMCAVC